ncbi:MAG: eukaryotic-like serine/threonine-protein kinase [Gaiellaceae bacterium]|nr:eukaryotic-like serine/threonine-protein kinase [Gaiellaceae bacterium]
MAVTDSLIDTLFDGRYRIVRKLGAGGMADVYLAEDQELGRRVAIKILNGRHANDDQFIERFRREAKNAAALNHPNIVSIYDRGEAEDTYYIAMEYLDGRTLKELVVGRGPAPVKVAVEYARQILSALRFAHKHGIVHRDIKPHNVLVDREGRIKVTDFGIARAGTSQMTEAGSIVGTAQYLSPEQARGTEVDQRSDLYSLGIVLYELLTGQTPFDGNTPVEIAMKHLSATPRPASQLRRDIPRDLDMVIMRALAKDPAARYQSADEMEADLDRALRGAPVAAATTGFATELMRAIPEPPPVEETSATIVAPRGTPPPPPAVVHEEIVEEERDRPMWPWILAALFVVAAAIAGIIVWNQLSGGAPQEPVALYSDCVPQRLAERQITAVDHVTEVRPRPTGECEAGQVYDQDPSQGETLSKGSTVVIWVSTGKPKVEIPPLKGKTWEEAKAALIAEHLKPEKRPVPGGTKDIVTATSPPAGKKATWGDTVKVNVGEGPRMVAVPSVFGETLPQATADLQAAGFRVNPTFVDNSAPANTIVGQDPPGGKVEPVGTYIKLSVSNGPPQTTVPDVTQETSEQAQQDLKDVGFKVLVRYVAVTDETQDNIVQSQTPDGDAQAPEHSTVTIYVGRFTSTTTGTTPVR